MKFLDLDCTCKALKLQYRKPAKTMTTVLYFFALSRVSLSVLTTPPAESPHTINVDADSWQKRMNDGAGMYVMQTCGQSAATHTAGTEPAAKRKDDCHTHACIASQ